MRAKNNIFRDGKIHVCKEMCSTCVFRKGNLMDLRPGRLKGMMEETRATGGTIPCHSQTYGVDDAICRGFYDRRYREMELLQLADRLDLIEWIQPEELLE